MSDPNRLSASDMDQVRQGLRMATPPDPVKLAEEEAVLAGVEQAGLGKRIRTYLHFIGPGYMQSAMTLGGGTAVASLFAGAAFGYKLLWVAPLGMLLGVIMLMVISHQTLCTGKRPFAAMAQYAGKPFAWGWAFGALVASIVWHFPQYSLASAVLADMGDLLGYPDLPPLVLSGIVLVIAVVLSSMYGSSPRLIRWYERILKYMVWGIVLCFGLVVVKTGITDWGELWRGFFTFQMPPDREGVAAGTVVISGLSAAVGINMVFLYPYSLLARGWGRGHRRLARFDLLSGMLVPYILATSLVVIATANTPALHDAFVGKKMMPVDAAQAFVPVVGPTLGRVVFNLGVLGMALSTITLHMICSGFVCMEIFGWEFGSWKYRLATLLPIPGVLGPVFGKDVLLYLAIPTNVFCGFLLPVAYIGFIFLQRNREYLGDDQPRGGKGLFWLVGMILVTLVILAWLLWFLFAKVFV